MARILIGPANHAGQAAAWAAALRETGTEAASFAFRSRPQLRRGKVRSYGFPADVHLPFPKLTSSLDRAMRMRRLVRSFDHIALDGFLPVLGSIHKQLTLGELGRFREWGVRLALIAHGSDVRDPHRHTRENPHSYFPLLEPPFRSWLAERATSNRALAAASGLPLYVSTPDLLLDLPHASWLPLCVDPGPWTSPARSFGSRPRVLHAPTSNMKGSEIIDPVLRNLAAKGHIEYVRPTRVAHDEMPGLMAASDVVIDQIRSGSYGVTTVEAMMSGALVVGHVSPAVRALLPTEPGIVEAPPDDFAGAMERLLDARASWLELADQSNAYAHRWHDGAASARALRPFTDDA